MGVINAHADGANDLATSQFPTSLQQDRRPYVGRLSGIKGCEMEKGCGYEMMCCVIPSLGCQPQKAEKCMYVLGTATKGGREGERVWSESVWVLGGLITLESRRRHSTLMKYNMGSFSPFNSIRTNGLDLRPTFVRDDRGHGKSR